MSASSKIIETYGMGMTVGTAAAKGFLSAVESYSDREMLHLPAGTRKKTLYRLITDCAGVSEGMSVICGERELTVLSAEPVSIFGEYSHTECLLSLKGGTADV